jgi:hypothetical protein
MNPTNPRPLSEQIARVVLMIVAVFLTIAATFALFIACVLLFPGTPLDTVWAMKAGSRDSFASIGALGVVLMLVLAAVLIVAAIGLFRRRSWARWLAFALLVINVVPDAVQGFAGEFSIFVPISIVAAVAVYLALPVVGRACRRREGGAVRNN